MPFDCPGHLDVLKHPAVGGILVATMENARRRSFEIWLAAGATQTKFEIFTYTMLNMIFIQLNLKNPTLSDKVECLFFEYLDVPICK